MPLPHTFPQAGFQPAHRSGPAICLQQICTHLLPYLLPEPWHCMVTGTSRAYRRSEFRWSDGTSLTASSYQNWGSNQPSFTSLFPSAVDRQYCTAASWRFKNAAANNAFQWFSNDCQTSGGSWHWYLFAMCKTLRKPRLQTPCCLWCVCACTSLTMPFLGVPAYARSTQCTNWLCQQLCDSIGLFHYCASITTVHVALLSCWRRCSHDSGSGSQQHGCRMHSTVCIP